MLLRTTTRTTLLVSTMLLATACTAKAPDDATATATMPATAATVASASSAAVTSPAAMSPAADASAASSGSSPATAAAASAVSTPAAAAAATAAATPAKGMPPGATPVEGTDYQVIDTPDQPTGKQVQVVEVFGYSCIHCFDFQPDMSKWAKAVPADVQFSYMPADFGGIWDAFAHAFYAAQAMGILEKSHDKTFNAVWVDKRVTTADDIPKIYADYGVDPKVFASTMQSFAVGAKVAAAHEQELRWGIEGTPTIVVDGKYRAIMTTAGGAAAMLHTVDWLIAKQRPAHAGH
jgi:thiol:disulfide interchange protein DsbA